MGLLGGIVGAIGGGINLGSIGSLGKTANVKTLGLSLGIDAFTKGFNVNSLIGTIDVSSFTNGFNIDSIKNSINLDSITGGFNLEDIKSGINIESLIQEIDLGPIKDMVDVDSITSNLNLESIKNSINIDSLKSGINIDSIKNIDLGSIVGDLNIDPSSLNIGSIFGGAENIKSNIDDKVSSFTESIGVEGINAEALIDSFSSGSIDNIDTAFQNVDFSSLDADKLEGIADFDFSSFDMGF